MICSDLNFYGLYEFYNVVLNSVVLQRLVVYAGFVYNKCIDLVHEKEMFSLWLKVQLSFNDDTLKKVQILTICYKSYYCINGIWRRCNVRNTFIHSVSRFREPTRVIFFT